MEMSYRTDGINSYLVIDDTSVAPDSYEVNMITNNDIEGLLPFEFRSLNEARMIYYRINGYMQLTELIQGEVLALEYLTDMFLSLIKLIFEIQMYILNPDNLIIHIKNIYFNMAERRFCFIYCPNNEVSIRKQLKLLMEECIKYINHRDHLAVDIAYGIYDIVSKANYDIKEIENHICACRKSNQVQNKEKKESCVTSTEKSHGFEEISENNDEQEMLLDMLFPKEPEIVRVEPDKSCECGRKKRVRDICFEKDEGKTKESKLTEYKKRKILNEKEKTRYNYKKMCIIAIVLTCIAGFVMTLIQYRSEGQIEYVKLLMVVLMMMAIECFVYLQLSKCEIAETSGADDMENDDFNSGKPLLEVIGRDKLRVETSETQKKGETSIFNNAVAFSDVELNNKIPADNALNTTMLIDDGRSTTILTDYEGDTTVLTDEDERIVSLEASKSKNEFMRCYRLVPCSQGTSTSINIYTSPVIIGRDRVNANYIIDNKAVSRIHAKVYTYNNNLLIEDMNSTNGTYINDCLIEKGHPIKANMGDIISFGSVSYSVAI